MGIIESHIEMYKSILKKERNPKRFLWSVNVSWVFNYI